MCCYVAMCFKIMSWPKNEKIREIWSSHFADYTSSNQSHEKKIFCCKGRIRTYTRQLAGKQGARAGGQPQSTFRLSRYPHPRDKRVCLPVSSPHNIVIFKKKNRCKGRIRTYKRRLSSTCVEFFPYLLAHETSGYVCQFHHLTLLSATKNLYF